MAACRRRRADLPDRLHGVGEDDGGAPAGRAPGVGVRRPRQGHRGRGGGTTVPDIFAAEGEAGFRKRETEALREVATSRKTVVATGGGAPAATRTSRRCWRRGACSGWRSRPRKPSSARGKASGRPLLDGAADPVAAARSLLECAAAVLRACPRAHRHRWPRRRGDRERVLRASLMMGVAGGMSSHE